MAYLLSFILAFGLVYIFVPIIRFGAIRWQFVDLPNHRKIHVKPMPLMGGLAIYLGFIIAMITFIGTHNTVALAIIIGGLMIVSIGLWDDWFKSRGKDLPAWPKFIVQILAGLVVVMLSIRMEGISNPFGRGEMIIFPYALSLIATLIWVVAIMNMMNFLDGADGLASGISTISGTTLFIMTLLRGQESLAILSLILVGASIGFLRHNFHPAKIFMGDAGSMFIGFTLAVISLEGTLKSVTMLSLLITILALGVPIFDTLYVMLMRIIKRKPLHHADRSHAHHRLLKRGLTQRQTVMVLYMFSIGFSILSLMTMWLYR